MAERSPLDDATDLLKATTGFYPHLKRTRTVQNPQAAKNVPIDLARGALAGVLGAPGDIESLIRMLPYLDEKTVLPTSEDIEKRLPLRSETPVSKAATGLGILGGGFYTGPGSPLRVAGAIPAAVRHGAEEFAKASVAGVPHVIKRKGGNWLTGSVEDALKPLKRDTMMGAPGDTVEDVLKKKDALNNWVDRNLANYVKKEMATPEDPVRGLIDKGISHLPQDALDRGTWLSENMEAIRRAEGFPGAGMANTEMGRGWENLADEAIQITAPAVANEQMLKANPWLSKLEPDQSVYRSRARDTEELGFDHIMDVLREDVAAGRIRPEQLNKVSMEQAVRRTYEYDQEMARKMRETALKNQEGFPLHKEYPEGYKWIELAMPKPSENLPQGWTMLEPKGGVIRAVNEAGERVIGNDMPELIKNLYYRHPDTPGNPRQMLEEALKYEGNAMGHCVGGYCPDVVEGRSRIFSLRDAKGEPHVTVEARPKRAQYEDIEKHFNQAHAEVLKDMNARGMNTSDPTKANGLAWKRAEEIANENPQMSIIQIKGKQNAAPKADYLPYVQDFVKGGNWTDVGDLKNTGMVDMSTYRNLSNWLKERGVEHPRYVTKEEFGKHEGDYLLDELKPNPDVPPATGMKRGGVAISHNPDTMMLELGNKRMKEGGAEDDTKPYFGGAGTKKYAAAKKRAEQADVNLLKDPKTYAAIMGLLGEAPDQMGFSVLHPDYQGIKDVAEPAFYAGTALGVAPVAKAFKAPAMALGRAGEKYAEKVVPQIMERGGLGAEILGGLAQGSRSYAYLPHTEKNPNPLVGTRYKTQHVGNLAPKTDFDIQAEQGSSVMSNPWDLTSRGEQVLEVSDIPLTNQIITEGGHDFARDLANIQANIGGASGRQIAERMQDRVNDAHFANLFDKGTGRVFTMPSTMDVKGSHFSTMPTDIVMDIFQQAGLKPKDVEKITDDLRTFTFETERGKFANAAPVGSPEFLLQLRQGGKGFSAGDLRKGLMDRMIQKEYQKMLGFNIEDVYGAIGDQSLKGLPKGFVGNTMIETSPFADVIPATHQSYDTANLGKYAGSMPSMPLELMMPDLFRAIEINYLKDPRYRKLTPMQLRTMIVNTIEKRGNVISQPINQRVVDNVMRYQEGLKQGHFKPNDYEGIMKFMQATGGYKEGGEVTKPAGGAKQPAAYIDGNEFVLAAKKYGIKDSMNNLNKIVDLVNKGLSVDDAARQVADTGMHKAAGGAITGDDLIIEERPL